MRKPHLAALAGLLALAAAVPAAADPVRLDEAALGGVAAGADVAAGLNLSSLDSTTNTTNTSASVFRQDTVAQTLGSRSANTNFATAISSSGVVATGNAVSSVSGSIMPATR